jgi:cytochrome P450/NADPH-cytochrome P450 reductase
MFDSMKDIAAQLIMKWSRFGDKYRVPVTDDFTRLTLDTLALCAMDYRFNSFYAEEMHPFVEAMVGFLSYAAVRARRPTFLHSWYSSDEAKWQENIDYMRNLSNELVQARKDHPKDTKDLLNAMINGKDPKTGKAVNDESIIDNLITFLIAGHETTSGKTKTS